MLLAANLNFDHFVLTHPWVVVAVVVGWVRYKHRRRRDEAADSTASPRAALVVSAVLMLGAAAFAVFFI